MKQLKYLLVIFILCLSCTHSSEPKKPENLISKDKMVDIMIDLSIVSSAKGLNKKLIERNGITPDEYIFKRHEIDSSQFTESNTYYSYYIDDYKLILNRVEDSLGKLKFKYMRLAEKEEEIEKPGNAVRNRKAGIVKKRDSLIDSPIEEK